MKALQDFVYVGVEIKDGQEILPGVFDEDQTESLLRLGWISDGTPKPEPVMEEEQEEQIDEPVKRVRRSKSK